MRSTWQALCEHKLAIIMACWSTAGGAVLDESNGRPFSARGHDTGGDGCPDTFQAGWWYAEGAGQCASCTPNGPFESQSPGRIGCDGQAGGSVTLYLTPWDYLQDGECQALYMFTHTHTHTHTHPLPHSLGLPAGQ